MKKALIIAIAVILSVVPTIQGFAKDSILAQEIMVYCNEIGDMYEVQPEIIMAIIENESGGNQYATNGSCKGLMQVSEYWHADRMERLGVTDIFDARSNILVGTDYLAELIEKNGGNIGASLMEYNGDSDWDEYLNGQCELSNYARTILKQAYFIRFETTEKGVINK